ncbi:autotransporter outer membrane beta-barrel domain-containing protein [Starkeya koreensis]|uniref:Autotransporter outer membrane beta-barrel domain-containing protein n=1 Tax=Ancylobacter koreensis TaxID=266121 RepID=A0ABT0DQC0_9HYPH|nr:autotransporter outer membrane beta-barrel domain-containing protein [Ancylobacter koreensis]MCK0209474.1 autotransporter outer membrane beta-barrel domain-containing protein [Ancylobacter koreensis]
MKLPAFVLVVGGCTVDGTPIAVDAATMEAGIEVKVGSAATLGVAYNGQFGDGVSQNGFNATLRIDF